MTDQATYGATTTRKITVGVVGAITAVAAIFYGISVFEAPIRMKHISTPGANPPANYQDYYTKSDGKLYKKNSGGTETEVGSAAGTVVAPTGVGWYGGPNIASSVSVAHNGTNLYVAVGTNVTFTSSDAITWTPRTPAYFVQWKAVTYAPDLSLWAALSATNDGSGNRIMTSPDGENWTGRSSFVVRPWAAICWSPTIDTFVGVATGSGAGDAVVVSTDGITWNGAGGGVPEDTNEWKSVCWSTANNLFVAVASTGTNRVMTSPDGSTWTARAAAEANAWTGVCWSQELGLFAAVASDGTNRIMTSPTGTTWTARSAETGAYKSITYSATSDLFVAVGEDNKTVTSPDGITWTSSTGAYGTSTVDWVSLTEFSGVFVSVGSQVGVVPNVMYGLAGNRLPSAIGTDLKNVAVNQIGDGSTGTVNIYNDMLFLGSIFKPQNSTSYLGEPTAPWQEASITSLRTPSIKDDTNNERISITGGANTVLRDNSSQMRVELVGGADINLYRSNGTDLNINFSDTYMNHRQGTLILGADAGSVGLLQLYNDASAFTIGITVANTTTASINYKLPISPPAAEGDVLTSTIAGQWSWSGLNPSKFITSTGTVTLQVGGITGNTLNLFAGDGTGANVGGVVYIEGGDSAEVTGGHVNIVAGNALGAAGAGGDVFLYAGNSANGLGGSAFLDAGDSTTTTSGDLELGATNAEVVVLGRVTKLISMKGIPALNEAANRTSGVATLVAGTVTVSNTSVTANTRFLLTTQDINGGTIGVQYISARNVGTDFTITSNNAADTSIVYYVLIEPAP